MFEQIEKYILMEMERLKIPGLSICIAKDQDIIWSKGFGYANMEKEIPATENTVYRVASMTKPVVATGLLQWLEKGKFRLDDPVNDLLEGVEIQTKFSQQPTVKNLLTHTSGLPVHVPPIYRHKLEAPSLEELIEKYAKVTLPPNKAWVYSNTGFAVIGYLIGLFDGRPFPNYMKENVFSPLKMDTTDFELTPSMEKSIALGYERTDPREPAKAVEPYILGCIPEHPCGSLYTTVIDYTHFLIAHMNGGIFNGHRILKGETIREMHKLQVAAGASRSGSGLGWARGWHYGQLALFHGGGMPGWATQGVMYPDLRLAIVIFTNLSGTSDWRNLFTGAVLRMLLGKYHPFNPEMIRVRTVPSQWHKLAGAYVSVYNGYERGKKPYIAIKDGHLVLNKGGEEMYLEKIDAERYLVHGGASDGMELTFEYDEEGKAKKFDLGTVTYPRYMEEKLPIDEKANLVGVWHGEYVHPYGPFTMDLKIESATRAVATDMEGRETTVTDFKASLGRVEGTLKLRAPREYAGWEAWFGSQVQLKLAAINRSNKLQGQMILEQRAFFGGMMIPLTLRS